MTRSMETLADVLAKITRDVKRDDLREALIRAVWPSVAGSLLASRSRVVRLERHQLVVEAYPSDWAEQIRVLRPELLRRLSQAVPGLGLRAIRVQTGREPPPGPRPAAAPCAPDAPEGIRREASAVTDPELRRALLRTAGAYLSRQERKT